MEENNITSQYEYVQTPEMESNGPTLDEMEQEYQKKRRRSRRRNTIILMIALSVLVFVGSVSIFVFVNKYFAPGYGSQSESSQMPSILEEPKDPADVKGPGVENGPTVVLHSRPDSDTAMMTIPDIFQNIPNQKKLFSFLNMNKDY